MEITRCPNGHYYDADKCPTCPVCANENGTQEFTLAGESNSPLPPQPAPTVAGYTPTEPVKGGFNVDGASVSPQMMQTSAFNGGDEKMGTISETIPVTGANGQEHAKKGVDDYGQTMPAGITPSDTNTQTAPGKNGYTSAVPTAFNPVTGWLVCIEGASKGTDYRIRSQYNYIGRAKHMDICISGDEYISSEKAAILAYDDMERKFFIAPGMGHNLIRLNDKMVMGSEMLKAYDIITVGKTKLLFIPLCGEQFDWKNV